MEMVEIILLQNWQGAFKGTRLEVTEKKAKKMIAEKIARRVTVADSPVVKPEPPRYLTTEEAFTRKGKK